MANAGHNEFISIALWCPLRQMSCFAARHPRHPLIQPVHFAVALSNRELRHRMLVRYWLYCVSVLVLGMVVIGGATRLTDSGLSITEWQPVLGIIPPLSDWDWLEAFDKYQLIPEYQTINRDMSLSEFKFIYWWEWSHRFAARLTGLVVLVPLVWFWLSGKLEQKLKPRLVLLFVLGGLQGFIGWWMVKSGLVDRVDVSQYRLALHLTLAAIILAWCLWIARAAHASQRARVAAFACSGRCHGDFCAIVSGCPRGRP